MQFELLVRVRVKLFLLNISRGAFTQEAFQHLSIYRNLFVHFFQTISNKMSDETKKFTSLFRKIYTYYTTLTCSPVTLQNARNFSFKNIRLFRILLYIVIRILPALQLVHNLLLALGAYHSQFGTQDIFGVLESVLWVLAYGMYIFNDSIIVRWKLTVSILNVFDVCDRIWIHAETFLNPCTPLSKLKSKLASHSKRIFFHFCFLDFFQSLIYSWSLWGTVTYQVTFYSMFPWKSPLAENITWFLLSINFPQQISPWSFPLLFHSINAHQKETCIRALTTCVKQLANSSKNSGVDYSIEKIIQDYKTLHLATSFVERKLRNILLVMFLVMGVQQFMESYFIFQMIKMGLGFQDLFFLILDLFMTLSRIAHGLHALSSVDGANEEFWNTMQKYMMTSKGQILPRSKRNERMKLFRTIMPIETRLGPVKCSKNLVLTGMAEYTNYYVTAALWP